MLVVVKDKEGREIASHLDVTSITIDTSVTTDLTIEVCDDSGGDKPAYTVMTGLVFEVGEDSDSSGIIYSYHRSWCQTI